MADPGGSNRPRPPPPPRASFRRFFFFFAFHPGGRSGRRTVPLPHNVNDVKKKIKEKTVSELSDFFRPRGIWIPGPPFSQILDPPVEREMDRGRMVEEQ